MLSAWHWFSHDHHGTSEGVWKLLRPTELFIIINRSSLDSDITCMYNYYYDVIYQSSKF
jgi:hypothetical protein